MAICPNCGRQTMRTADWACQWCGYPLLSGAYKKIDKTFKELQEERRDSWRSVTPEPGPEFDFENEAEEAPEPEPAPRPKSPPRPAPAPELKRPPEPEPEPEAKPESEPEPEAAPELELKTEPGPAPEAEAPPELVRPPEPAPVPALQSPPGPSPAPEPVAVSQPLPAPEPEPVAGPTIKLEEIRDGMTVTVDDLDALFRGDKAMLNSRLTDKTLLVKGNVSKVFIRDHIDVRYILLSGLRPKTVWSARCGFAPEQLSKMSRLNEGETVTIRGKYDGYSKNIILKDCVLAD